MTAFFSIWLAQSAYYLEMWPTHKMHCAECELIQNTDQKD